MSVIDWLRYLRRPRRAGPRGRERRRFARRKYDDHIGTSGGRGAMPDALVSAAAAQTLV